MFVPDARLAAAEGIGACIVAFGLVGLAIAHWSSYDR
jgi:hypothetical protein